MAYEKVLRRGGIAAVFGNGHEDAELLQFHFRN
jgi:hypothetical protein